MEQKSMKPNLKPCAHCGCRNPKTLWDDYFGYQIYCPDCDIGTGGHNIEHDAASAWNRRT